MKLKKIFAVVVAAVMAVTMNAMPAFAAPDGGKTCSICQNTFATGNVYSNGKTYETVYNVSSLSGLTSSSSDAYFDWESNTLYIAYYNGNPICKNCLEAKIAEYKANQSTNQTGSTNVTATVSGSYTLVVPQTVAMTGADGTGEKTATIPVCIKGDIGENQKVTVTTVAPVMKSAGSADVTATIDAPKTEWNRADVIVNSNEGTTSNYTVKAMLTPGEWDGTATFNCTLDTTTPVKTISFTVDGTSYNAEDGMTWTQFVESTYNDGAFTCDETYARYNGKTLLFDNRTIVKNGDTIIASHEYLWGMPSPSV